MDLLFTLSALDPWCLAKPRSDHIGMPVDGRMDALEPEAASTCSSSNPPRPCKISKAHNMASNFPTPTFFLDSFFFAR